MTVAGALNWQGHDLVQPFHRGAHLLPARQQARDLTHRGHGAAGQQGAGDQAADGKLARADQVDTGDDHTGIGQFLHGADQLGHDVGDAARLDRRGGHGRGQLGVGTLQPALGARGFDGFKVGNGFQQQPVQRRRLAGVFARRTGQFLLHQYAGQDGGNHTGQHDECNGAADEPDHADKDQHEGQVADCCHCARGEKFAHGCEIADLIGEHTCRGRLMFQPHVRNLVKQLRGQPEVKVAPRHVHQS